MTRPVILEGYKLALDYDSDGAGTYIFLGAINAIDLGISNTIAEAWVRDNASPFAKPTRERRVTAQDSKIQGSGYYDNVDYTALQTLSAVGTVRNWRVRASGGNTWVAAYLLESIDLKGDATNNGFIDMTISLVLADNSVTVT